MSLLKLKAITKRFGAHAALSDVALELQAGEVLAVLGENGAGKSTLIKTLAGAHRIDAGEIYIDDRLVDLRSPTDSIAAGIAVIYQELTIVPELSVAENLFLGHMPTLGRTPLLNRRDMFRQADKLLKGLKLPIDPRRRAGDLSPGYQQMVEIGRAINRKVRVVLMDEPTSYLSESEVKLLFDFIRQLKGQGLGILFISHHLEEVFEICDRAMVLRDGRNVDSKPVSAWTSESIVKAMVNRSIEQFYPYRPRPLGEVSLTVSHLATPPLTDVSFQARAGEILGISGVVGSGRSELLKAVFGALPSRGTMQWEGRAFRPKSPSHAIRHRLALVPEDRKLEGLMLDASVENNVTLSMLQRIARYGFVNFGKKRRLSREGIQQFAVACRGPQMAVRYLSGGNQQKVVFARTSATNPRLYLLDEPTRGVDVGAKVEIYNQIMRFAEQGCTVLLVSSELPELLGLCDRIIVLNASQVVGNLSRAEATHEKVLHLSTDEQGDVMLPDDDAAPAAVKQHEDQAGISRHVGV